MAGGKIDYQKLNTELEKILELLESSDLEVDVAIKQYQRGMEILERMEEYLKTAENKVKKVQTDFSKT